MSGREPEDGNTMEFNETTLKERFDAAVGDLSPDVPGLVRAGAARGAAIRRRRRRLGAAGVVIASALVVGGVGFVAHPDGLLGGVGPAGHGPGVAREQRLVTATPRGMAAAVMAHLSAPDASIVRAAGSVSQHPSQLLVELGYRIGSTRVDVQVEATLGVKFWGRQLTSCNDGQAPSCTSVRLADGTQMLRVDPAPSGPDPSHLGLLALFVNRGDQLVAVIATFEQPAARSHSATSPPRLTPPISFATLQSIGTDPLVGVRTSSAMNARGNAIEGFRNGTPSVIGYSSGSASATAGPAPAPASAPASASTSAPASASTSAPAPGSGSASGSGTHR